jgi:hypothetical protein
MSASCQLERAPGRPGYEGRSASDHRPSVVIVLVLLTIAGLLVPHRLLSADPLDGYETLRSRSGAFIIYYPPRLLRMAEEIEGLLEESAGEIAGQLGLERITPIRVYLASGERAYRELHRGRIPEWGAAFSDLGAHVLGIDVDLVLRSPRPLSIVVRHELSHLLFAERVGEVPVPTWFLEGVAMMQAHEWSFADEWRFMTMVTGKNLPYLEELNGPFHGSASDAVLSYGLSYIAVETLLSGRPEALMTFTAFLRDTGDFNSAFAMVFGQTPYDFGSALYVSVYKRYKTPGLILNASPYWLGLALLFVSVYVAKRVRNRRKLDQWEEDEAARSRFSY